MMYIMKESCVKFGGTETTSNWHTLLFRYHPCKAFLSHFVLYVTDCTLSCVHYCISTWYQSQVAVQNWVKKKKKKGYEEAETFVHNSLTNWWNITAVFFKLSYDLENEPKTQSHQTLARDYGVKLNSRSASCKASPSNSILKTHTLSSLHLPRQSTCHLTSLN